MSFDIHLCIPENSERGHLISSLAAEEHLSPNEVVERIIDLAAKQHAMASIAPTSSKIPGLASEPMSEEDARIVDAALALVMDERRKRSELLFGA